ADTLLLAGQVDDVDLNHVHIEALLDGAGHVQLGGVGTDLEDVLAFIEHQVVALLGQVRLDQHVRVMEVPHYSSPPSSSAAGAAAGAVLPAAPFCRLSRSL